MQRDEKREGRDWRPGESNENERKRSTWLAISSGTKRIDESETEIVFRIKYDSVKEKKKLNQMKLTSGTRRKKRSETEDRKEEDNKLGASL